MLLGTFYSLPDLEEYFLVNLIKDKTEEDKTKLGGGCDKKIKTFKQVFINLILIFVLDTVIG